MLNFKKVLKYIIIAYAGIFFIIYDHVYASDFHGKSYLRPNIMMGKSGSNGRFRTVLLSIGGIFLTASPFFNLSPSSAAQQPPLQSVKQQSPVPDPALGVPFSSEVRQFKTGEGQLKNPPIIENKYDIRVILSHLGYSESAIPGLLDDLQTMFYKINIEDFKNRIKKIESLKERDPDKYTENIKNIIADLWLKIMENGYFDNKFQSPLVKSMITRMSDENIFDIAIGSERVNKDNKAEINKDLFSCVARSQLSYIILTYLELDVKAGFSFSHVFAVVRVDSSRYILADFTFGLFERIDKWYTQNGNRWALSGKYHVSAKDLAKLQEHAKNGNFNMISQSAYTGSINMKNVLNLFYRDILLLMGDTKGFSSAVYNIHGIAYFVIGDSGKSEKAFKRAVGSNSEYDVFYFNMGTLYERSGQVFEAMESFKKFVSINQNISLAYHNLAKAYLVLNQYGDADEAFKKALLLEPNNSSLKSKRAETLAILGMSYANIAKYEQNQGNDSDNPYFFYDTGLAYYRVGRYRESFALFEKALELGIRVPEAYLYMGLLCDKFGMRDESISNLAKAVKLSEDKSMLNYAPPYLRESVLLMISNNRALGASA